MCFYGVIQWVVTKCINSANSRAMHWNILSYNTSLKKIRVSMEPLWDLKINRYRVTYKSTYYTDQSSVLLSLTNKVGLYYSGPEGHLYTFPWLRIRNHHVLASAIFSIACMYSLLLILDIRFYICYCVCHIQSAVRYRVCLGLKQHGPLLSRLRVNLSSSSLWLRLLTKLSIPHYSDCPIRYQASHWQAHSWVLSSKTELSRDSIH